MRYGVCLPNLGEFAEPDRVGELAQRAEAAGWDGFFVWDHVVFAFGPADVADPWVLLTVAATRTSRIALGPLVTAVARRRPGTLARQTTSLDRLSGGRLVFGAGLGFTLEAEFGTWGEPVEPRIVAERLDEGLEVLTGLWSGEPVTFRGTHLTATDVTFRPTPVQRPRPPVWIGCNWPARRPLRRAARWDGVAPMIVDMTDGSWGATPAVVNEIVAGIAEHRGNLDGFDVVITGRTPEGGEAAREVVEPIAAAGATWWLEGFRPAPGEWDAAAKRIDAGPPRA
ncbi:LLM class flavin-dependent oxidoreductase [Cryptosporangium aurantiacum]|uniref:Flavin-dependent oxidoreductase, luciferase family (Includes alkanesulfonate monooxygenase SsuD and methylene tetrahydromethanopterin reductase) n=1 Tax=Cryptosporangium aurantiacum TaxID=134849 RepID=A0A1M7RK55_9ACTN|nr:LLM class flavin-dependent oxidoreductase [Cryptosporangium aurantiacum]SHN46526.1 Flavin-dependent oxidoreductase, luciferase family (includes alkanesulfonate monooxygenase SsuD and methylene tetrahydromethanopterin reductase) [Cryptosporangium aurantiacum]